MKTKSNTGPVDSRSGARASRRSVLTVATVVFNAEKKIRTTVESALSDATAAVELIVVDGASSDGTIDVVRGYGKRIAKFLSEPDRGITHAFNKGIELAEGDLIGFLNAGDWYEPEALSIVADAHDGHPDIDVFCGAIRFWEGGRSTIVCHSDPTMLDNETSVYHPTVFIRKSAYEKFGMYDESYRYAMDYELLLRFKQRGAKFMALDNVLANMPLDGVSYKNWYAGLLEVRRARSTYFSSLNVEYHHLRAVTMNLGARFLKRSGMNAVYQSYWQLRTSRGDSGRGA